MSAIVDFPVKPEARPYLDAFEGQVADHGPLAPHRRRGLTRFAETGFPSRKSESWRYLDLRPLAREPLLPAAAPSARVLRAMGDHLTGLRIRTDLSVTLFLSEPDEYDGGELVVEIGRASCRKRV